jgi:hypothetical protein
MRTGEILRTYVQLVTLPHFRKNRPGYLLVSSLFLALIPITLYFAGDAARAHAPALLGFFSPGGSLLAGDGGSVRPMISASSAVLPWLRALGAGIALTLPAWPIALGVRVPSEFFARHRFVGESAADWRRFSSIYIGLRGLPALAALGLVYGSVVAAAFARVPELGACPAAVTLACLWLPALAAQYWAASRWGPVIHPFSPKRRQTPRRRHVPVPVELKLLLSAWRADISLAPLSVGFVVLVVASTAYIFSPTTGAIRAVILVCTAGMILCFNAITLACIPQFSQYLAHTQPVSPARFTFEALLPSLLFPGSLFVVWLGASAIRVGFFAIAPAALFAWAVALNFLRLYPLGATAVGALLPAVWLMLVLVLASWCWPLAPIAALVALVPAWRRADAAYRAFDGGRDR